MNENAFASIMQARPCPTFVLSPLLTKRVSVRILFGEADISDFEILIAFWLTARRHLPGEMGHIPGGRPLSYLATSPADLPRSARRRIFMNAHPFKFLQNPDSVTSTNHLFADYLPVDSRWLHQHPKKAVKKDKFIAQIGLTAGRHLPGRNGAIFSQRQAALTLYNIARGLAQNGSPPPFPGETLRVSVDQCTFG